MSGFQGIVTGNLANTPINKSVNMSPTEVAAFGKNTVSTKKTKKNTTVTNSTLWEVLDTETWTESGSTVFKRITRRMPVDGGHVYSVTTHALNNKKTGNTNFEGIESLLFVAHSNNAPTKTTRTKK